MFNREKLHDHELDASHRTDAERNFGESPDVLKFWIKAFQLVAWIGAALAGLGLIKEVQIFKETGPLTYMIFEGAAHLLKKKLKERKEREELPVDPFEKAAGDRAKLEAARRESAVSGESRQ